MPSELPPPRPFLSPVLSVSALIAATRLLIERNLPLTWVSGEISNFTRAASGHSYFVLKDAQAQVRCVFFRTKAALAGFALRDGLQVEVRAQPTLYEARGEFQLNVDAVRLAGAGALYEQFLRLKSALEARGWFAADRKRALPRFPRAIGIVTSPKAAALRDVITTLRRRSPHLRLVIYPCAVQGKGAAEEIAQAIRTANARRAQDGVETLLVCRGGGSIEDLWSFNEEVVAQAIVESALPVVSGVGHETDFTICDFVADARAPTPTGAAQLAAPARDELDNAVRNLFLQLRAALSRRVERDMQRVDYLSRRLQHPAMRLRLQGEQIAQLARRLQRGWAALAGGRQLAVEAMQARWLRNARAPLAQRQALHDAHLLIEQAWGNSRTARARRVERCADALRHLNPEAVLERGFAIVTTADNNVVQHSDALRIGQSLRIRFAHGGARASVTEKD
jgi:exodeoxyribonuclease VII large subunit